MTKPDRTLSSQQITFIGKFGPESRKKNHRLFQSKYLSCSVSLSQRILTSTCSWPLPLWLLSHVIVLHFHIVNNENKASLKCFRPIFYKKLVFQSSDRRRQEVRAGKVSVRWYRKMVTLHFTLRIIVREGIFITLKAIKFHWLLQFLKLKLPSMLVLLTYYKGIFRIKEAVFKTSNIEEQLIRRKASEGEINWV